MLLTFLMSFDSNQLALFCVDNNCEVSRGTTFLENCICVKFFSLLFPFTLPSRNFSSFLSFPGKLLI